MSEPWRASPGADYMAGVLDGSIPACHSIRQCVERAVRDHKEGPSRGLEFRPEEAEFVIEFSQFCIQSKGKWAGKPLDLMPWELFITSEIFGWYYKESGRRRIQIVYIEIPKKNGKTEYLAFIGNYMLVFDGEMGAEVYSLASNKDQARLTFDESVRMVRRSPSLAKRVRQYRNNLHVEATESKYEPLASKVDTIDGRNPSCQLIDELHRHRDGNIWDLAINAVGARENAVVFGITTAGKNPIGVCYEQHEYGLSILEQVVDNDRYFCFIATPDKGYDWRDKRELYKLNPSLGTILDEEQELKLWKEAVKKKSGQAAYRRYRFNEWTNEVERWIPAGIWKACDHHIDPKLLKGQTCYGGLDLGLTDDMSSFVLLFDYKGYIVLLCWYWCCEESVKKRRSEDDLPYDKWVDEGYLTQTEGNVTDFDHIEKDILEITKEYQLAECGFDPYQAKQMATRLQGAGLNMVEIRQATTFLHEPMEGFMRNLLKKKVVHYGHPILQWNAFNVVPREDRNKLKAPDKKNSREKIDGISATINAISCLYHKKPMEKRKFELPLVIRMGGQRNAQTRH